MANEFERGPEIAPVGDCEVVVEGSGADVAEGSDVEVEQGELRGNVANAAKDAARVRKGNPDFSKGPSIA